MSTNYSHISRAHISKSKRCLDIKSSTYCFHIKTKILADFQICISVSLTTRTNIFDKWFTKHYNYVENLFLSAYIFSHSVFTRKKIIKQFITLHFWDTLFLTFLSSVPTRRYMAIFGDNFPTILDDNFKNICHVGL